MLANKAIAPGSGVAKGTIAKLLIRENPLMAPIEAADPLRRLMLYNVDEEPFAGPSTAKALFNPPPEV